MKSSLSIIHVGHWILMIQLLLLGLSSAHGLSSPYSSAVRSLRYNIVAHYEKHGTIPKKIDDILVVEGRDLNEILREPIKQYVAYYGDQENLPLYRSSRILALISLVENEKFYHCFLLDPKGQIEADTVSADHLEKLGFPVPQGLKVYKHTKEYISAREAFNRRYDGVFLGLYLHEVMLLMGGVLFLVIVRLIVKRRVKG